MSENYDAIVIGTGQSGPALAVRCAKEGLRTAILERSLFGGTCVNVGCTPTKTLIASARAAHMARRGAELGVCIEGSIRVDMKRVKNRMDEVVRRSSEGLVKWLKDTPNLTVLEEHGRFEGSHAIRAGGKTLAADKIFINVGARAAVPNMPGTRDVPFLTNSDMMEMDEVPDHLIVVGGSYVGLEIAQMYRRFGSRVTVVERGDRLVAREDDDVSAAIKEILEAEGIAVRVGAECISLHQSERGVGVGLDCADEPKGISGSQVLLAVGRTPNTHDLGLDTAGIRTDERGYIEVDDQLRTNVEGVWALGDVNGRGAFTHTSYNDYEIVVANLFDGDPRRVSDRIPIYALFIDPPLGRVGLTERQVRASGTKALVGTMPMTRVARAREHGETQGFMKILVDADTRRILGASVLGLHGDEVIHLVADVMYADAPYTVIQRAVHIHPTVGELIPTMLGDLRPL